MKKVKMITIDNDIEDKLSKEDNASRLINYLLRQFYSSQSKEVKDLTLEEIKIKKQEIYDNKEKIEKLEELERELIESEEEKERKEKEKRTLRLEGYKPYLQEWFEVETEELNDLIELYDKERIDYESLYKWGKAKGLKEKDLNTN